MKDQKTFQIILTIMHGAAFDDKKPRLHAVIEDHSEAPHKSTALQSSPLGEINDIGVAAEFARLLGSTLVERLEPCLSMPYKKDSSNPAEVDVVLLDNRTCRWAEKLKTLQSTEP